MCRTLILKTQCPERWGGVMTSRIPDSEFLLARKDGRSPDVRSSWSRFPIAPSAAGPDMFNASPRRGVPCSPGNRGKGRGNKGEAPTAPTGGTLGAGHGPRGPPAVALGRERSGPGRWAIRSRADVRMELRSPRERSPHGARLASFPILAVLGGGRVQLKRRYSTRLSEVKTRA